MRVVTVIVVVLTVVGGVAPSARAQGIMFPTAGPINSSMAGASTAAAVDVGASYWNPATISGLDRPEFLLGAGLFLPSIHLQTGLPAGSVGGIFPPTNRYGQSRSDGGVAAGPAVALAFRLDPDSPLTLGLGLFGLLGGGVNYPGSSTTPVLAPHDPPRTFGVGPIYSNAAALGVAPMASYQVTDRLSIGGGPVISQLALSMNPAFFAPGKPDPLHLLNFPAATNSRPFWGGGFQVGLFANLNDCWNVGFSYKSPIWQERWGFNSSTANLSPRRIGVQATIPEIFSWGIAYKGLPRTLLDLDLRYFDYGNTDLFGQKPSNGGLGWRSILAVAFGAQYQATDALTFRAGYLFNQNPIPHTYTLFNVQLPGIITNTMTMGATLRLTDDVSLSFAWLHGFRNSISGPIGQVPGASARFDAQLDTLYTGFNVQFGSPRKPKPAPETASETEGPVAEAGGA